MKVNPSQNCLTTRSASICSRVYSIPCGLQNITICSHQPLLFNTYRPVDQMILQTRFSTGWLQLQKYREKFYELQAYSLALLCSHSCTTFHTSLARCRAQILYFKKHKSRIARSTNLASPFAQILILPKAKYFESAISSGEPP